MKTGEKYTNPTKDGVEYERKVDLLEQIKNEKGFNVRDNDIWYKNTLVARVLKKHELYRQYLRPNHVEWQDYISKQLLPDNCLVLENKDRVIIVEVKYQEVPGSVDEKLQTCAFKKMEYEKLFKNLNKKVDFYFLLNRKFFDKPKYDDVFKYIKDSGCKYYFDHIPPEELGLK